MFEKLADREQCRKLIGSKAALPFDQCKCRSGLWRAKAMRRVIGLRMSEACDGPYSGDQIKPTFSMSVFGPMVAWAFKGRVLRAVFCILEDEAFEMNSLQTRLNELFPNDNETLFSEAAGKDMNVHFWLDSDGIPESDYEQDEESDEAIMEHIDNVITTVR